MHLANDIYRIAVFALHEECAGAIHGFFCILTVPEPVAKEDADFAIGFFYPVPITAYCFTWFVYAQGANIYIYLRLTDECVFFGTPHGIEDGAPSGNAVELKYIAQAIDCSQPMA